MIFNDLTAKSTNVKRTLKVYETYCHLTLGVHKRALDFVTQLYRETDGAPFQIWQNVRSRYRRKGQNNLPPGLWLIKGTSEYKIFFTYYTNQERKGLKNFCVCFKHLTLETALVLHDVFLDILKESVVVVDYKKNRPGTPVESRQRLFNAIVDSIKD